MHVHTSPQLEGMRIERQINSHSIRQCKSLRHAYTYVQEDESLCTCGYSQHLNILNDTNVTFEALKWIADSKKHDQQHVYAYYFDGVGHTKKFILHASITIQFNTYMCPICTSLSVGHIHLAVQEGSVIGR